MEVLMEVFSFIENYFPSSMIVNGYNCRNSGLNISRKKSENNLLTLLEPVNVELNKTVQRSKNPTAKDSIKC